MSTCYAACHWPQNSGYIVTDSSRMIDRQCVLQCDDALIFSGMLWKGQFYKERRRKKLKEEMNEWTP